MKRILVVVTDLNNNERREFSFPYAYRSFMIAINLGRMNERKFSIDKNDNIHMFHKKAEFVNREAAIKHRHYIVRFTVIYLV